MNEVRLFIYHSHSKTDKRTSLCEIPTGGGDAKTSEDIMPSGTYSKCFTVLSYVADQFSLSWFTVGDAGSWSEVSSTQ